MAQFKTILITALFIFPLNLKFYAADGLVCYRCHGCEDVSNEPLKTCATEEKHKKRSEIGGLDVSIDPKKLVDSNRAEDETWWCYSERMKHGTEEHTVRDCTADEHYCHTTTNTNCVQCLTDGCNHNSGSSIIISSLTLTVVLVITRFLN